MEMEGARHGGLEPGLGPAGHRGGGAGRAGATGRMSGRELRDFASEQRRIALDELQTFAAVVIRHRHRQENLEADLAGAWADLLQLVLPSLDAATMKATFSRLGLTEIEPGALARRSQARQVELIEARAALDRDPTLADAAKIGADVDRELERLEERLEGLGKMLDALEAEPMFFKLIAARFDTPDYQGRFWQRRYQRHRRQAAFLVERHGPALDAGRFAQLYKRYVFEKAIYDRLSLARASLLARAADVAALARRRSEIDMELSSLPEWDLAYARAGIRQQLTEGSQEDRLRPLLEDPTFRCATERVVALQERRRRLAALRAECLDEPRREANQALARVDDVLAELRPLSPKLNAVFMRDEMEGIYGLPLSRWRDLRSRYDNVATSQLGEGATSGT